ncbi:MAG: TonB-dependent receptor [Prevotellaceae bacterium]|jgi:TonB-linked SusC/RagA family outer membrane protein|nr:TonB-dependent receptor [Prevotellaceae bacterium]
MNVILKKQSVGIHPLLRFCLLALLAVGTSFSLRAQLVAVTGRVADSNNEPVAGATVIVKGATTGVLTDVSGAYSINAPSDATLLFSFMGFVGREEVVDGRTRIDVVLTAEEQRLDEVVVVGYGTQRKVTLTGAVAGVKGAEVIQTRNENVQNMLTGKIAGVRVWQKSAEPGTFNNNFDIRGMGSPLVVIDGIPRTMSEFQRLNPNDIDDVSVLKDASAAIYGVRAANGVLLVTTKKGTVGGSAKVTYTGSFTLQQPSNMPKLADAFDAMTIYNEKTRNNADGSGAIVYTPEVVEEYRNGTRRTTDWNSLVFSDFSPQMQHDVSISGGNERTQYYISMGYFSQEGFFKSGDLNYNKTNLRSNITTRIAKGLKLDLNLSGILDQRNNPYSDAAYLIRTYWRQGVLHPAYADPEQTMLNYEGLEMDENTVAMMTSDVSGYRQYNQKYIQSSAALNYDFGTITSLLQGLSAKAQFSYDYRMDNNKLFRKEYSQYAYSSYEQKVYSPSSPSRMRREFYDKQQVLGQLVLNYDRAFGEHKVNGVAGLETQKREGDNFYALRDLAYASDYLFAGVDEGQMGGMQIGDNDLYELANSALIGRINYAYGNRYIAEVQFRYDGSSKLAPGHQWGFFPSASVGWRLSEEPLFKSVSALSFINQLKVRASYGVLGDDGSLEYDWAMGYTYPATSDNAANGYYNQHAPGFIFDDQFIYGVATKALPNENITWFTSRTLDVGVDFEAWNGLFGLAFDYFDRRREGRFARNTGDLPTVVGATAPRENLDSDRHFGIDVELSHKNKVGDVIYKVKAIGTITRNMYLIASEKGPWGNSYDRWRNDNLTNRYQGVQFGYEGAGRFTSWQDIWSYSLYHERDVLPGDYKYVDWNGDGEINGQDEHPYAFDQTPWLNYSLSFDVAYRNFDLNVLFQGSALGSMQYQEPLYSIWGNNGGGVLEQYLDRWHPVDPQADPYNPATEWISGYYGYTGHYPRENSDFNRVSTAYLRLKSIEFGYTLPKIKALPDAGLRVFVNAYNLFTITGVKFVDPEHPEDDLSRLYPLNKTYSVGLTLSF